MESGTRGRAVDTARAGFSMVEIALVTVFLLVAVGGLSSAVISALKLSRTTEETSIADDAARQVASDMQRTAFADVFRTYNTDPDDDLPGAPGAAFDVRGLTPRQEDPDGRVGRVLFPSVPVGGVEALREDVIDPRWAMENGRDLNGDDLIDTLDHAGDYLVLPARVVVEWTGAGGDRLVELDLCLLP